MKAAKQINSKQQKSADARAKALNLGLKTYDGKPCKFGHTEKYVSNSSCVECSLARVPKRCKFGHELKNGRCPTCYNDYRRKKNEEATASWEDILEKHKNNPMNMKWK